MSDRNPARDGDRDRANKDTTGNRDKSTIDKLIDKAQEKGVFGKAERMIRDRFGGGRKRR